MHLRAHITRINPVDTQRCILSSEHMRELFQRRLARSVATPAWICLNTCVTCDIDNTCSRFQVMLNRLDQGKWRDNIGTIDLLKHIKWILQEKRLWTGT